MIFKRPILIIVESLDINDSSASKGRITLIQNLKAIGCDVKVLHFTRRPIELKGVNCVPIKEQKWHPWYILSKTQILIWRLLKMNINPFFEKRFGFSFGYFSDSFSIKKAIDIENPDSYDFVLTLSKAASFRSHHAILKCPKWHSKWLAYIHDPYPMHFYPRPYNWVAPGYYQQQEFMRAVSKACAYGVFPSKLLQEWMGSYFPDFLERGLVIPHQIAANVPKASVPDFYIDSKFVVLHAGSLMKQRDPRGLVAGFELFLKHCPQAKKHAVLHLVGKMDYHQQFLQEKAKDLEALLLDDFYINFNTVYAMQQAASVNVVLEAKAEISPFLPGKVPHCVQSGKPLLHLGPATSETRRILGTDYPYHAEIDDVVKIAELLAVLYYNWQKEKAQINFDLLLDYMGVSYLKNLFNTLSLGYDSKNKQQIKTVFKIL